MPPTGQPSMDFSMLDDADLAQMLRDYGVDVGPINVATRRTYERKLMRLKTGQESSPTNYAPVDNDEDEEEEVQLKRPATRRAAPVLSEPPQPRMRPAADYRSATGIDSRPSLSAARKTTSTYMPASRASPQSKPQTESKGIPVWVKLLALAVVLILVYLIYLNMEPQAVSNIPSIDNKVEV